MNTALPMIVFFILNALRFTPIQSVLDPCAGQPTLGQACDRPTDCKGLGTTCISGTCQCHADYTKQTDPDTKAIYCQQLPQFIDSPCTGACKPPMFCNANKCACVRSIRDGNRCYGTAVVGDSCRSNADCPIPFGFCSGGTCSCAAGSSRSGSACSGDPALLVYECPTGARAQGSCVVAAKEVQVVQNTPNSGNVWDNCPAGSYCYAPVGSSYGNCCPAVCPLNSAPDTTYSCDPTATLRRCPSNTHHCYRSASSSHSSTVCCRLPCREPTPVYVNGNCYPRSYLGSPCQINEQCDGGYGMACSGGICRCAQGFVPYSDSYTTGDNPAQVCVRDCGSRVKHAGECFNGSSLGSGCQVNEQCPSGAVCFRGVCFCDCRQGFIKGSSGTCIKGLQTTLAPFLGVGSANSKLGSDKLLGALSGILPLGGTSSGK